MAASHDDPHGVSRRAESILKQRKHTNLDNVEMNLKALQLVSVSLLCFHERPSMCPLLSLTRCCREKSRPACILLL